MLKVSISVFLRFSGAAAKLALLLYLAKFSSTESLGQYGIIVAIVAVCSQIVGLDVHYFNSRIISSESKIVVSRTIKSQIFLHIACYFLFVPLIVFIDYLGFFETSLFIFVFLTSIYLLWYSLLV